MDERPCLTWWTEMDVGKRVAEWEWRRMGRVERVGYDGSRWAGPTPKKSRKGSEAGQGDADNARGRVDGSGRGGCGRVVEALLHVEEQSRSKSSIAAQPNTSPPRCQVNQRLEHSRRVGARHEIELPS